MTMLIRININAFEDERISGLIIYHAKLMILKIVITMVTAILILKTPENEALYFFCHSSLPVKITKGSETKTKIKLINAALERGHTP